MSADGAAVRVGRPAADPQAELARLRRVPGPWLHLLDAAPADARQLGWMLDRAGVVVRILRGDCGRSGYGFFDEVGAALQLPGDPVADWAALGALLADLAWLPGAGHVLVVTRASLLLAEEPVRELRCLVEAVREVARGRAEEGDPVPFHLVLQDDAVGLAALRARLDAVGAEYADLSGWDAEEPAVEAAASGRSVLGAGDPRPDAVDLAAGAAVSGVDGVVSLRRAWEDFRGGAAGTVRVYAPVLAEPNRAALAAATLAAAAARLGAACVVVPVPATGAFDRRQAAVAEVATVVWPAPEVRAPEAQPAEPAPEAQPAPPPVVDLPADVPLSAGPGAEDVRVVPLAGWAAAQPGVVALVTGWAGTGSARTLVVGIAVDGAADPEALRAAAGRLVPAARVELFAPSRGLSPAHLRLVRTGTRAWQRRTARSDPAPPPTTGTVDRPGGTGITGALSRPAAPRVVALGPPPLRDTDEPRPDVLLAGFTLAGIDRRTALGRGEPVPDDRDAALVEWAKGQRVVTALLRAVALVGEETFPVYCACVTAGTDPEAVRQQLAAAVAGTGIPKAAAEAFTPAGAIPAFHLDLALGSTRLWPASG